MTVIFRFDLPFYFSFSRFMALCALAIVFLVAFALANPTGHSEQKYALPYVDEAVVHNILRFTDIPTIKALPDQWKLHLRSTPTTVAEIFINTFGDEAALSALRIGVSRSEKVLDAIMLRHRQSAQSADRAFQFICRSGNRALVERWIGEGYVPGPPCHLGAAEGGNVDFIDWLLHSRPPSSDTLNSMIQTYVAEKDDAIVDVVYDVSAFAGHLDVLARIADGELIRAPLQSAQITACKFAICGRQKEVVAWLLNRHDLGVNDVDLAAQLFVSAAMFDHLDMMEWMALDLRLYPGHEGLALSFIAAAQYGHVAVMMHLLHGQLFAYIPPINVVGEALRAATAMHQVECVQLLLKRNVPSEDVSHASEIASAAGNETLVRLFLQHPLAPDLFSEMYAAAAQENRVDIMRLIPPLDESPRDLVVTLIYGGRRDALAELLQQYPPDRDALLNGIADAAALADTASIEIILAHDPGMDTPHTWRFVLTACATDGVPECIDILSARMRLRQSDINAMLERSAEHDNASFIRGLVVRRLRPSVSAIDASLVLATRKNRPVMIRFLLHHFQPSFHGIDAAFRATRHGDGYNLSTLSALLDHTRPLDAFLESLFKYLVKKMTTSRDRDIDIWMALLMDRERVRFMPILERLLKRHPQRTEIMTRLAPMLLRHGYF